MRRTQLLIERNIGGVHVRLPANELAHSDEPSVDYGVADYGFLYQKIANATRATVMIHRTMSLLRFFSFSSAIKRIQHTANLAECIKLIFAGEPSIYGFPAGADAAVGL